LTDFVFTHLDSRVQTFVFGQGTCNPNGKRDLLADEPMPERRSLVEKDDSASASIEKRQANTPFLAEVRMFAFKFCPIGWALADGSSLPINQNQALFALIGTIYGGDGTTTFKLPDLRPYALTCTRYCIALSGIFPSSS